MYIIGNHITTIWEDAYEQFPQRMHESYIILKTVLQEFGKANGLKLHPIYMKRTSAVQLNGKGNPTGYYHLHYFYGYLLKTPFFHIPSRLPVLHAEFERAGHDIEFFREPKADNKPLVLSVQYNRDYFLEDLWITNHAAKKMVVEGISVAQICRALEQGSRFQQTDGYLCVYSYFSIAYKKMGEKYKIKTVFTNK